MEQADVERALDTAWEYLSKQEISSEQEFFRQQIYPAAERYYWRYVYDEASGLEPLPAQSSGGHDCLQRRCELQLVRVQVFQGDSDGLHVCLVDYCQTRRDDRQRHNGPPLYDVTSLYVCPSSGQFHRCGDAECQYALDHLNEEHFAQCPLTGIVCDGQGGNVLHTNRDDPLPAWVSSGLTRAEVQQATRRVTRHSAPRPGPVDQHTAETLVHQCLSLTPTQARVEVRRQVDATDRTQREARRRHESYAVHASWRMCYFRVALIQVAALLNLRQMRDRTHLEEVICSNATVQLDRYVNERTRTDTLINLYDMFLIVSSVSSQFQSTPYVFLSDSVLVEMVVQYAKRVVALWHLLMTETNFSTQQSLIHRRFYEFVESAMILFRDGFVSRRPVSARRRQQRAMARSVLGQTGPKEEENDDEDEYEETVVFAPDTFLRVALPEAAAAAQITNRDVDTRTRNRLQRNPALLERHVRATTRDVQLLRPVLDHCAMHPHEPLQFERLQRDLQARQRRARTPVLWKKRPPQPQNVQHVLRQPPVSAKDALRPRHGASSSHKRTVTSPVLPPASKKASTSRITTAVRHALLDAIDRLQLDPARFELDAVQLEDLPADDSTIFVPLKGLIR